jgi:hypothetical protein
MKLLGDNEGGIAEPQGGAYDGGVRFVCSKVIYFDAVPL